LQAPNPFANISLEAKTAFVYDLRNQKMLFGLHEERPVPIASITKIMTALVALDMFKPTEEIVITADALKEEGDNGLFLGEKWPLDKLIQFMLITSSNDAAEAIAEKAGRLVFLEKMNQKAKELGFEKTNFHTISGVDLLNEPGALATAKEVAFLLFYAYNHFPEIFGITAKAEASFVSLSGLHHNVKNTNPFVDQINALASKTGFTKMAGGNLVVLLGENRPAIISVLGSSADGRFLDVQKLAAAALLAK